jgi:uncharacterized membrane protein AbrB (regulator of aidB expression)
VDEVTLVVIILVVFVGIVVYLDRRSKSKGSLFTGKPTMGMRILALLLGIVCGGVFVVELLASERFHLIFPILAIAGIAYGLGATALLKGLQQASGEEQQDDAIEPHQ